MVKEAKHKNILRVIYGYEFVWEPHILQFIRENGSPYSIEIWSRFYLILPWMLKTLSAFFHLVCASAVFRHATGFRCIFILVWHTHKNESCFDAPNCTLTLFHSVFLVLFSVGSSAAGSSKDFVFIPPDKKMPHLWCCRDHNHTTPENDIFKKKIRTTLQTTLLTIWRQF